MAMHASPLVAPATEMSFEEFLVAYDGVHAEWVDGTALQLPPIGEQHSRLKRFLGSVLQGWAEVRELGEVYLAPFTVRLNERIAREPDLFFVARRNADRVRETHVEGAPDLVIEVASPLTRSRERGEKWYEYEEAGVREYWLIDPLRMVAETWVRDQKDLFRAVPPGEPATLRSEVLAGLSIPVDWLWRKPLPALADVYKEWGLR